MAHRQDKDIGSQSGARDVRKTPGKGPKLPPMPAARRMTAFHADKKHKARSK
jgi:hypothetical protein